MAFRPPFFCQAVGQTWSDHLPLIALGSAAKAVISHRTNDGVHVCMCTLGDTSPPARGECTVAARAPDREGARAVQAELGVVGGLVAAARQFTPRSPEPLYSASAASGSSRSSVRSGVRTGRNRRKQDETRSTVSPRFPKRRRTERNAMQRPGRIRNQQVSGSSPLVGSSASRHLRRNRPPVGRRNVATV